MRQSILLKLIVILVGVAVVGGGVVWGLRVTPEVRGDTEPAALSADEVKRLYNRGYLDLSFTGL